MLLNGRDVLCVIPCLYPGLCFSFISLSFLAEPILFNLKTLGCCALELVFLCCAVIMISMLASSHMHPLLRKALVRLGIFLVYGWFVAWIFTLIEKQDEPAYRRMERMLKELRTELNLTCMQNKTDDCFDIFVRRAAAAVDEGNKLDWTFMNALAFLFASFTTIGKVP